MSQWDKIDSTYLQLINENLRFDGLRKVLESYGM